MSLTILKIGGSIITHKERDEPVPNKKEINRIASEIKQAWNGELILIHGAGSYGHPIVKRTRIHEGIENEEQLVGFAKTQTLQNELNTIVCNALINEGVPAIPIQASSSAVMEDGELKELNTRVIAELVNIGMVPVLYGVPAYDSVKKCSVLSGDEIITYLSERLKAGLILHATNVDGVYDKNPKKHDDAELIKEVHSVDDVELTGSNNTDVTGGMLNKVKLLLDNRIKGRIFNGGKPGLIRQALNEERVGTLIKKG